MIVKREKVCDNCSEAAAKAADTSLTLMELLDSLTPAQQRAALVHLSVKWAEQQGKSSNARAG